MSDAGLMFSLADVRKAMVGLSTESMDFLEGRLRALAAERERPTGNFTVVLSSADVPLDFSGEVVVEIDTNAGTQVTRLIPNKTGASNDGDVGQLEVPTLARLRAAGWAVAVHNDYRIDGVPMTFWLLTHPSGRWIKGEGRTDEQALAAAEVSIVPVEPSHPTPYFGDGKRYSGSLVPGMRMRCRITGEEGAYERNPNPAIEELWRTDWEPVELIRKEQDGVGLRCELPVVQGSRDAVVCGDDQGRPATEASPQGADSPREEPGKASSDVKSPVPVESGSPFDKVLAQAREALGHIGEQRSGPLVREGARTLEDEVSKWCRICRSSAHKASQCLVDPHRPAVPSGTGFVSEGARMHEGESSRSGVGEAVDWSRFVPTEEIPDCDRGFPATGDVVASTLNGGGARVVRKENLSVSLLATDELGDGDCLWNSGRWRVIRHADGRWADGFGPDGPLAPFDKVLAQARESEPSKQGTSGQPDVRRGWEMVQGRWVLIDGSHAPSSPTIKSEQADK